MAPPPTPHARRRPPRGGTHGASDGAEGGSTATVHMETPTDEISQQVCAVMVRVSVPNYYRMNGSDRMVCVCVCVIAGNGPRWPRGLGERGVRN